MNRRRARIGFTLIELVVAMTIFLLLVSAAMGTYAQVYKTTQRVETQEDMYQTGRVILAQLSAELASAYQPPVVAGATATSSLEGDDTAGDGTGLQADKLIFLTTAHPADETNSRGDVTQVTYSMNDPVQQELPGLYLEEDLTPGLEVTDNTPERYRLSPLVLEFNCKYLTTDGDWQNDWVSQTSLPAAVRVELTLQDHAGKEKPLTLVATTNLALATLPPTSTSSTSSGGTSGSTSNRATP